MKLNNNKTKKMLLTLAIASSMGLTLGGCSSFQIGESEFGCPTSAEGGVECASVRDIYSATNNKDEVTNVDVNSQKKSVTSLLTTGENYDPEPADFDEIISDEIPKGKTVQVEKKVKYSGLSLDNDSSRYADVQNPVIADYLKGKDTYEIYKNAEADLKEIKERHKDGTYIEPNLVRQPAVVIRVWLAPFVDEKDRWVNPEETYVEIEPIKWIFGDKPTFKRPVIEPLLRDNPTLKKPYNGPNKNVGNKKVVPNFNRLNKPIEHKQFETHFSYKPKSVVLPE